MTILGIIGDHPGDDGWPLMAFYRVLILLVMFMYKIPSILVHFLLVDFEMVGDQPLDGW